MKIHTIARLVAFLAAAASPNSAKAGKVSCGDTITGDTKLDGDLECCGDDPALTVTGSRGKGSGKGKGNGSEDGRRGTGKGGSSSKGGSDSSSGKVKGSGSEDGSGTGKGGSESSKGGSGSDSRARFDLDGYTVSCNDNSFSDDLVRIGILVDGSGASVFGGTVEGFNFGIHVAGDGRHTIDDMHVAGTGNDALLVSSSNNQIRRSSFDDCGQGPDADENGDCIDIESGADRNSVRDCSMSDFGDDGIDIDGSYNTISNNEINGFTEKNDGKNEDGITTRGTGNSIVNNNIYDMYKRGIDVKYNEPDGSDDTCAEFVASYEKGLAGGSHFIMGNEVRGSRKGNGIKIRSDGNQILSNVVYDNDEEGFKVDRGDCDDDIIGGSYNTFRSNESFDNEDDGFEIEGNSNTFADNEAFGNKKNGFKVEGSDNKLTGNKASSNGDYGFLAKESGDRNVFRGNRATDNEEGAFGDELKCAGENTFRGNKGELDCDPPED